jgi:hypothetical protein
MSLLVEYINKGMANDMNALQVELLRLIGEYNKIRGRYLFVFSSAIGKQVLGVGIEQSDFYVFYDMLSKLDGNRNLDIFLETPGGSGETTEEIVEFLRSKFDTVAFVVAGEAKSAGTIMVLSGDEILMTETGSLGPIDAQIRIGRSVMSAHDYMDWVKNTREEAQKKGELNPFDATMVAQITPGEIGGVYHSLEFARDLVRKWLVKYKFKNWTVTESKKLPVTKKMKEDRADEISAELTNHSRWRSHGRSIKAANLESIGLKIERVERFPELTDVVNRIKTVCSLIYDGSNTFKIFATEQSRMFRTAAQVGPMVPMPQAPDATRIDIKCEKCGKPYNLYAKLKPGKNIDDELKKSGLAPFPKDSKLKCTECGHETDLSGIKNQIEVETGKKFHFDE